MFNIQGSELIFLLLIALVILGPEKLPDAVRKFGRTYAEFKKFSAGFQGELRQALDEPMRELRETADAVRVAANFDFDADGDTDSAAPPGGVDAEERARRRAEREARGDRPQRQGDGQGDSRGGAMRPTIRADRSTPLNFGDPAARVVKGGADDAANDGAVDPDPGEDTGE